MTERAFRTLEMSDPAFERDGLRHLTVKSEALGRRGDISLWIPDARKIGTLLILLHGVYGSHWVWEQKGGVHRTAQRMVADGSIAPMVIAMPSDGLRNDGSAYLPWPDGENAEAWIVDEVPVLARIAAPALQEDARVAIGGLSMGGYGALRLGAKYPDRFSAISAHSAITRISEMEAFVEEPLSEYLQCAPPEELDVLFYLKKAADQLPKLRFDCGVNDDLITGNRQLHTELLALGIKHEYQEYPGGHQWEYWQKHVAETLRFCSEA